MSESALGNFIPLQTADRLIAAHDGDVALLYLYRLRTGESDCERAARDLCRTLREIEAADEKLRRLGLSEDSAPRTAAPARAENKPAPPPAPAAYVPPAPADEMPEYRAEDLVRRSREDGEFAAIIAEASKVMGRALSSVDMKTLFGIYDYLGMPADVIMLLINHCAKQYSRRYGTQRRPSARAIQKEAYFWVNREIMTVEQAEEFIRADDARRSITAQVCALMGIAGREPTKTENEYISSWLDMGFPPESIAIAYDRTVTNTGSLRWSYMNRIILSWKEKGLFTPRDIEEKDSRQRAKSAPGRAAQRGSRPSDFEGLDSLLDKI